MRPRVPFLVVVSLVAVLMAGCSASPAAPREASPTSTSACAAASSLPSGETTRLSLTVAGEDRLFDVHVPAGHDGTTPSPLILGFAGYRAPVGELEREVGLNDSGAVVVYPQPASSAVGTGWQERRTRPAPMTWPSPRRCSTTWSRVCASTPRACSRRECPMAEGSSRCSRALCPSASPRSRWSREPCTPRPTHRARMPGRSPSSSSTAPRTTSSPTTAAPATTPGSFR